MTGNTVIDALLLTVGRELPCPAGLRPRGFLLVTAHRRESFGAPLGQICAALRELVARNPSLSVVYPVHPNPNVRAAVTEQLGGRDRIHLIEPTTYPEFVALMQASFAILTDSGGVQEEAPSLGKPVLVLRTTTERPEAVEAGAARLVGTDPSTIVAAVEELVQDHAAYDRATPARSTPTATAARRSASRRIVAHRLGIDLGPPLEEFCPGW